MGKCKNITNQEFHLLTAIQSTGRKNKSNQTIWLCQCQCGNMVEVPISSLINNNTKSCGCLNRCINTFEVKGEYTVMFDSRGNSSLIDTEDLDRVKQHYWMQEKYGYWVTSDHRIRLHNFIMQPSDNLVVDHIYHKKYDNRKSKLRICSVRENNLNRDMKLGKVPIRGVNFNGHSYTASITVNYKTIYLGSFTNIEDAHSARLEAENYYNVSRR